MGNKTDIPSNSASALKHEAVIRRLLTEFHEGWMSDSDKAECDAFMFQEIGSQLNSDIEAGLANGHSVEEQEIISRKLLRKMLSTEK